MLKVLSELDFIYNEDGLIKINSHSSKRYRDESSLPPRQSRIEVEKDYCTMTFQILKMDKVSIELKFRGNLMDLNNMSQKFKIGQTGSKF